MVEARRPTRRPYVTPRVTFPSAKRMAPEGGASGNASKAFAGTAYGPS
jgi:hypothetical protein